MGLLVITEDEALKKLLTTFGALRPEFVNRRSARRLRNRHYQLVVIDVRGAGAIGRRFAFPERGRLAPTLVVVGADCGQMECRALDLGADDYVREPHLAALERRLRAHLRARARYSGPESPHRIRLDGRGCSVCIDDSTIDVTQQEYAMLAILLEHSGQPVPKKVLADGIWRRKAKPARGLAVLASRINATLIAARVTGVWIEASSDAVRLAC
jgi:DNA-binding response OmpR family regulator